MTANRLFTLVAALALLAGVGSVNAQAGAPPAALNAPLALPWLLLAALGLLNLGGLAGYALARRPRG